MRNKNLLITGAATRVGKAIALHFAERGWNIALHYFKSSSKAKKLKRILEQNWVKVVLISQIFLTIQEENLLQATYQTRIQILELLMVMQQKYYILLEQLNLRFLLHQTELLISKILRMHLIMLPQNILE